MVQSSENVWTRRFQLLIGLTLVGEIILGLIVYRIFEYSYTRTELALTSFLLVCGIIALSTIPEPVARRIILGAGAFILIALLALSFAPGLLGRASITRQSAGALRQFLASGALVLALVALLGKIVTDKAARTADMTYERNNWFAGLEHLALAAIAGVELLVQISSGNQIRVLPFNSVVYAGLSLNNVAILLLGAIAFFSLVSFRSALTWLDGLMVLILAATCGLFQYTFGGGELARLIPTLSQGLISNSNLVLSLAPLVLAVFAILTEWARFVAPLWLAIQVLILQQFITRVGTVSAGTRAGGGLQTASFGQIVLFVLATALILLALRLILYWDRRTLNGIDGITVAAIAVGIGLTAWSLTAGRIPRTAFTASSLTFIVYMIAICAIIALALICIHTFFSSVWLSHVESIVGILLTLSITVGALLLLNTTDGRGSYITATTLNPHTLNPSLPQLLIRNQYILDGLFVVLLLIYILALIKQRLGRSFAHTERALLLLSGLTCLLALAGTGRGAALPLVTANLQRLGAYSQTAFNAENIATIGILIAALLSLLWLFRVRSGGVMLAILFGAAALCVLVYYFALSPFLLLCSLLLLTAGTLIATRIERIQERPQEAKIENNHEITVNPVP